MLLGENSVDTKIRPSIIKTLAKITIVVFEKFGFR